VNLSIERRNDLSRDPMADLGTHLWHHPDDGKTAAIRLVALKYTACCENKARCSRRATVGLEVPRLHRPSDLAQGLLRRARTAAHRQGARALTIRGSELRFMPEAILTVAELAEYLRAHPSTIYKLLRAGKIPAFKIGDTWRFNRKQIDEWRGAQEKRAK